MRKQIDDHIDTAETGDSEIDDDGDWLDEYPSETIRAVDPDDVTSGIDITLYDLDRIDSPLMVEIQNYYPPEDDYEGSSVYIHGEYAVLQTLTALADLLSDRFDEYPWWFDENNGGDDNAN